MGLMCGGVGPNHTVVELPAFRHDAESLGVEWRVELAAYLSKNPTIGDLIVGGGCARKFR